MVWFFTKKREIVPTEDDTKRQEFSATLKIVVKKILSTRKLDQLMIDMSPDICALFNCERFTLYTVNKDRDRLLSKIKSGMEASRDIVLPLDNKSIAGWVALSRRAVRLQDAYDRDELRVYSDELTFCRDVDELTGYRTKQMLAAPIFREKSTEIAGVIQLLNRRDGSPFSATDEQGLNKLCKAMGMVIKQRMIPATIDTSKYRPLVEKSVISQPELELAARSAQRKNLELEDVLIDEFQVPVSAFGNYLAAASNLPYESYQSDRKKPVHVLAKIDRDFVEQNCCLPIEFDGKNMTLLTIDPERAMHLGAVKKLFPYASLFYRITTSREFKRTVDDFLDSGS
jgi:hypothetical protein